jgi:uncharacterized FlaG/YvyC family protein
MLNGSLPLTATAPESMPIRPTAPTTRMPGEPAQVALAAAVPDVEIAFDKGMVRVFAVFQVNPETHEMQVSVVDDEGRLVRLIPPDSVAQMISAMAAYSRR